MPCSVVSAAAVIDRLRRGEGARGWVDGAHLDRRVSPEIAEVAKQPGILRGRPARVAVGVVLDHGLSPRCLLAPRATRRRTPTKPSLGQRARVCGVPLKNSSSVGGEAGPGEAAHAGSAVIGEAAGLRRLHCITWPRLSSGSRSSTAGSVTGWSRGARRPGTPPSRPAPPVHHRGVRRPRTRGPTRVTG